MILNTKSCPICGADIIIRKSIDEYYNIVAGKFKRLDDANEGHRVTIQCSYDLKHNVFDYPEIVEWYKQILELC